MGRLLAFVKVNGSCLPVTVVEVVDTGGNCGSLETWMTYAVAPATNVH